MRLCTAFGTYPRCLALQGIRYEARPVASGTFGDIWKGYYGNHLVCLKVAKVYENSDVEHLIKVNFLPFEVIPQLILLLADFHERGDCVEPPQSP